MVLAQGLLIAGIVEGSLLVGWRLTQTPKSQSLEFLLVSPVQPRGYFLSEACAGLARTALVTLAGVPPLLALAWNGVIEPHDVLVLTLVPWAWGSVAGLGLTAWAYESLRVRRIGEALGLAAILGYLIVGVLAGEQLPRWLSGLPRPVRNTVMTGYVAAHTWNPFAVQQYWFADDRAAAVALERMLVMTGAALAGAALLMLRAASRLKGHFHDRHYRPLDSVTPADPSGIRDRPLSWWAVRRVMEYSGRLNFYLAAGFGVAYAAFIVAGDAWPAWMGRSVFYIIEQAGGVPVVTTALVLLASVPAAFQYGLWDSSTQDRVRRLELLLLTNLSGYDYWHAAAAAAWRRGRGYFSVAVLLWGACVVAGRLSVVSALMTASSAVIVWGMYFALGFAAFSRGRQANGLGSLLVLGMPALSLLSLRLGWPALAALTPPGLVYLAMDESVAARGYWLGGAGMAVGVLVAARLATATCDAKLRAWYDRHAGLKCVD